jgi:hypothetical protein
MSAGNFSVCLFGEKFRKIQTPRTGRNILSQMPFFNNHQVFRHKARYLEPQPGGEAPFQNKV